MQATQSQIDDLVARPAESLPVEIKTWIDPESPERLAKIVRACLAMRNQNGGFLIIGLNDKTLQVETNGRPQNMREVFHTDKIQQIVSPCWQTVGSMGQSWGIHQRARANCDCFGHKFCRASNGNCIQLDRAFGGDSRAAALRRIWRLRISDACYRALGAKVDR